jgi:hypothetical protein
VPALADRRVPRSSRRGTLRSVPTDRRLLDELLDMVEAIAAGRVAPYNGAAAIWARLSEEDGEHPDDFREFVGFASEWQDIPSQREAIESDTLEYALEVLELYRSRCRSRTEDS